MPPPFLRPSYALPLRLINSEYHDTQVASALRRDVCLWHKSSSIMVTGRSRVLRLGELTAVISTR
jgi:hypothetical protein